MEKPKSESTLQTGTSHEVAILAGGCFWGVEELLRKLPGVLKTEVGYTGGSTENPTYGHVCRGNTGHAEAVRIEFEPAKLKYADLLRFFFRLHDPTTLNRQGNDVGSQYRSTIFVLSPTQLGIAEEVLREVDSSGKWRFPVVTTIEPAGKFYSAEPEHQKYLERNPGGYNCHYVRD